MDGGVVSERQQGSLQGEPLSPLLANIPLDEVDKVLQARGYSFADDCNVYVGSMKAGPRVTELLRKLYAGLKLQINEAKSAVSRALGRKFMGYALWVARGKEVKCAVAPSRWATSRPGSGNSHAARKENVTRQVAVNSRRSAADQPPMVAQQRQAAQQRADDCLVRPDGIAKTVMTSNSRTARCGPTCPVLWQGCFCYGGPLCRLWFRCLGLYRLRKR